MDTLVDVAQVVSMIAAVVAVFFAARTVAETRALRREERVARLLGLVAEVGERGTNAARGQLGGDLLDIARHQLRAAVKATHESLPECERLLDLDWGSYTSDARAADREREASVALRAALNEVAELLVRLRAEGS